MHEIVAKLTQGEVFFLILVLIVTVGMTIAAVAHSFGRHHEPDDEREEGPSQ